MNYSIVEFFNDAKGHSCGYCKSSDSSWSDGMWAHKLSANDYQELIDRGWRRSGMYCYKPIMNVTCCPLYTIRCDTLDFKLTKSQKKLLKKVNGFLRDGKKKTGGDSCSSTSDDGDIGGKLSLIGSEYLGPDVQPEFNVADIEGKLLDEGSRINDRSNCTTSKVDPVKPEPPPLIKEVPPDTCNTTLTRKTPRSGIGRDLTKPLPKKAKLIRLEMKKKKLNEKGITLEGVSPLGASNVEKHIEDFLSESNSDGKHNLELRLVRSCPRSEEFEKSFKLEVSLYQRYQVAIHNDPLTKCTEKQFTRFLVDSPIQHDLDPSGPPCGYGSFHQQYWLDGQLIAVAVIDILPKCVSSVYFYYDPDYSFLSLGTYSSLREVAFTRSLQKTIPPLKYYYMGFYVHSCPKMRYKANIGPSYLLCPEIYSWHSVIECIPKLNASKYSRFNEDGRAISKESDFDINKVKVLYNYKIMNYSEFLIYKQRGSPDEVTHYVRLVGKTLSQRILLYHS